MDQIPVRHLADVNENVPNPSQADGSIIFEAETAGTMQRGRLIEIFQILVIIVIIVFMIKKAFDINFFS